MSRASGKMPNSFDPANAEGLAPRTGDLIARRQELLGPAYRLMYEKPLEIVRGEGVWLYDADGRKYLDAYNNVPVVGHSNERVAHAICDRVQTLNTNTRYLDENLLDYSERLLSSHAPGIENVMYTCTGSEANDLALRIARHSTGASGVIITQDAYHGVTTAIAEISPSLGPNQPLGSQVRTVPLPQVNADVPIEQASATFAASVSAAIEDLEQQGVGIAALIVDTVFTSDGVFPEPVGFLTAAVEVVRAAGGLFVADEVQAGFGRTGDAMWGYERHGATPDLVTMGKPMGNGMPVAGVACRPAILEKFGRGLRYFSTNAATSALIAAAAAVLAEIEDRNLVENSRAVGTRLRDGLAQLATDRPFLRRVRGTGLLIAGDIVDPDAGSPDTALALRVANGLRDRGVLISTVGPSASMLKIRPPLVFDMDDADLFLSTIANVFDEEHGATPSSS